MYTFAELVMLVGLAGKRTGLWVAGCGGEATLKGIDRLNCQTPSERRR